VRIRREEGGGSKKRRRNIYLQEKNKNHRGEGPSSGFEV